MYLVRKQFINPVMNHSVVACTPSLERARSFAEEALARDNNSNAVYELVWVGCNALINLPPETTEYTGPPYEVVVLRLHRVPESERVPGGLPHRWQTWQQMKESVFEPSAEFAYRLLSEDPVALDVWQDVLARGG